MASKKEVDKTAKPDERSVIIKPPKFERAEIKIVGTSPYVQHKFSQKAREQIMETQRQGSQARKGRKREPKDFDEVYRQAMHVSKQGWPGIPANSFRNALISACRIVGFKMTLAKLSLFVEADGYDEDGTPLIRIVGTPRQHVAPARNDNGSVDIRVRPMWDEWSAIVKIRWDADQFSAADVVNLLSRVGMQVGIGEGRHDSKNSAGMGWGTFEVAA